MSRHSLDYLKFSPRKTSAAGCVKLIKNNDNGYFFLLKIK